MRFHARSLPRRLTAMLYDAGTPSERLGTARASIAARLYSRQDGEFGSGALIGILTEIIRQCRAAK